MGRGDSEEAAKSAKPRGRASQKALRAGLPEGWRRCRECKAEIAPGEEGQNNRNICKACAREASRKRQTAYRERNPERVKESIKRHREANPDAGAEAAKRFAEAHPERIKEAQERYRKNHAEELAAKQRDRVEADREGYRDYQKKWREENPTKVKEYRETVAAKNQTRLDELAPPGPCEMCGEGYGGPNHRHHLDPSTKVGGISRMLRMTGLYPDEELRAEVEKTVAICPSCHQEITCREHGYRPTVVDEEYQRAVSEGSGKDLLAEWLAIPTAIKRKKRTVWDGKGCRICGSAKSRTAENFSQDAAGSDGLNSICRECTRERFVANSLQSHRYLYAYKLANTCVDCGESNPLRLQFDHQTAKGLKTANISHLASRPYGIKRVVKEISKCDVRCANCHTLRTNRAA